MSRILHKFKIVVSDYPDGVLYAELDMVEEELRYAKTFLNGLALMVEYISYEEYASAVAHIMLRPDKLIY